METPASQRPVCPECEGTGRMAFRRQGDGVVYLDCPACQGWGFIHHLLPARSEPESPACRTRPGR